MDKITRTANGGRPTATTATGTRSIAGTTLSCGSLSGWPTASAVHFVTYKIDTSSNVIAGTQCDWKGIVSGTTITNLTLEAGTDAGNAIGDVVEMLPTAQWGEDLAEGLEVEHNRDGTHAGITATSITNAGNYNQTGGTFSVPSASISQAALPLGAVVQIVTTNFSAVATGTTVIPVDDTKPQITEGDEYMTQAITPKSTSNILVIEATGYFSHSATGDRVAAFLFQDSTANALAGSAQFQPTAGTEVSLTIRHEMAAGTTSATTFRVRAGGGGAGTTTFNGVGGTRRYGGITLSNIRITEHKA